MHRRHCSDRLSWRLCAGLLVLGGVMPTVRLRAAESQVPAPTPPPYGIGNAVNDAVVPSPPTKPQAAPSPEVREAPQSFAGAGDERRLWVQDFKVEGADFLDPHQVSALLEPYRRRQLTMEEIRQAANQLTVLCRRRGYLVARAYVPRQQVQAGVVRLEILPGRYGQVTLENRSRVRDSILREALGRPAASTTLVTRDAIDQAMLRISDLPGARLPTVTLSAGQQPGTSDMLVRAPRSALLDGYLAVDDYGTRFTGKYRMSAGLDLNSPLGLADRLSLAAMRTEAAGLQNLRAGYEVPLGLRGLRGEVAVSRTTYQLGAEYEDLQATGIARGIDVTFSYPLRRQRSGSLWLSLALANRRLQDEIALASSVTAKHSRSATFSVMSEFHGTPGGHSANLRLDGGLTYGRLRYDDPKQQAQNQAGIDTAGRYTKIFASLVTDLALGGHWSVTGSLRGQRALSRSLDGSEQFNASGPGGLHSYPDGVVDDDGYLVDVGLQRSFLTRGGRRWELGMAGSYAGVQPRQRAYSVTGPVNISEVGATYALFGRRVYLRAEIMRATGTDAITRRYNGGWRSAGQLGMRF